MIEKLRQAYLQYQKLQPKTYLRNIAQQLNSNEAQLLAFSPNCKRLILDVPSIVNKACCFDKIMLLCRNDQTVSEISGRVHCQPLQNNLRLICNPDSDTANKLQSSALLHTQHVAYIFLQNENKRCSLQFFDLSGTAIIKIFMPNNPPLETFTDFFANDNNIDLAVKKSSQRKHLDTLSNNGDTSLALNHVNVEFLRKVLKQSALEQLPLDITVSNASCSQSFNGKIHKVVEARGWYNVLDPDFSLHIDDKNLNVAFSSKPDFQVLALNDNQVCLRIKNLG